MGKPKTIEHQLLAGSLQQIDCSDNGTVTGLFTFAPDFPAFEGHFPGQPVLPAVVQLAAVRALAAKHLGEELHPVSIDRAKFKNMIGPDEPITVTLQLDRSHKHVTITFTITTDKGKAATGEIICRVITG